jgi:nephrocystin-3
MPNPIPQPAVPQADSRVIRVFISSTFRDMMRERDLLVKEVFPKLRRKCAKRFVAFTEVDLRWGITEAQANEGQVLPLCLAEIERSRPYFIGLLGERYGWIPDTIRPEVIAREPWLQEHVQGRTSVTELEILHGVLNNPRMQSHVFFYFRDPAYVNDPTLTDDDRGDMVEREIKADVEKYGQAEATRRTEERKGKLVALKRRIRDSKLPLADPYPNPKTLARLIRRQFNRLIDRLYPENQTPDPLAQERMAHAAHAKNKLFACIDRPAHLAALNAFAEPAEHNGKGLVVTGESGGGKTALLAAWARDWAKSHPEDFLFQHYFGATPDSASPDGFLRRLLGELKNHFGITNDIPTDTEKLRDALPVWLAQASAQAGRGQEASGNGESTNAGGASAPRQFRIVLVLDGLNQVQGSEPNRHLLFLPRHFPPHVVALASALSGPALDALRERAWAEHDLPCASEAEVDAMVGEYLKIHARTLERELRQQLVTAPGAKNPLFLRTVLEELRQFGSFERLPERVRHYLEADNPKDLFLRVLIRWQEDFDGKHPAQDEPKLDLVRRALTHLWAARQGLSEPEWLDLLGDGSQPLPRALWTALFLALESHLSQRAGLFAFGHDFLRQAVEAAFVPSDDMQQAAHLYVADYFERQPACLRRTSELPWQLAGAHAWQRLHDLLVDRVFFDHAWDHNPFDVKTCWAQIEAASPLRLAEAYAAQIRSPDAESNKDHLWRLLLLLVETGQMEQSLSLNSALVRYFRTTNDLNRLQSALSCKAVILKSRGEFDGAMVCLEEQEELCHRLGSQIGLGMCLDTKATILKTWGQLEEAMDCLKAEESIWLKIGNADGLAACLGNQAGILRILGRFDESMDLLQKEEHLVRTIGNLNRLANCIGNQAVILLERGDFDHAMTLLKKQEDICRSLGDKERLQRSLGNQANVLRLRDDFDGALALLKKAEQICLESGLRDELQTWIGGQALIYAQLGNRERCLMLLKQQEELCRKLNNRRELAICLGNQVMYDSLLNQSSPDSVLSKLNEQEAIFREVGDSLWLLRCLGNKCIVLACAGQLEEAKTTLQEARSLVEHCGDESLTSKIEALAVEFGMNDTNELHRRLEGDVALAESYSATQKALLNGYYIEAAIHSEKLPPDIVDYPEARTMLSLLNYRLSQVFASKGRWRSAIKHAKRALDLAPEDKCALLEAHLQEMLKHGDGI